MLAQFSIWPLDEPHMSRDVSEAARILDEFGLRHEVGPMGTTVEGEWDEVMSALRACHEAFRSRHQRVLTTIVIDDDVTRPLSAGEAVAKVKAQAGAS